MYGNNLQIERIRAEARQELAGKDEQLVNQLWDWTYLVFQKWKLEHGDRKPIPNRGLLSDRLPIPFDKAEPWECADFIFSSPVALAMKLLRDNYSPFDAVTDKVSIRKVLALVIVKSEHAADDDLFDAGEILRYHKTAEAGIDAGRRSVLQPRDENLAKGRPKGAQTQKEAAAERYKKMRNINADLLKHSNTARWTLERRAAHIRDLVFKNEETKEENKETKGKYSIGTIIGKIQGQA